MLRLDEIDGLYHLDPAHSALGFTVRHAGISRVHGTFDGFHGYAVFDASDVHQSALMVSVSTASINTQQADRDAHLRTGDFFDVATFPAMTYVGVQFTVEDESHVRVRGDLTIKDVTRPLELLLEYTGSATDPFGNRRIGFETTSRISRKDFGLTWNAALETGGWLVSDEIDLDIECSAVRQAEQDAGAPDAPDAVGATGDLGDLAMTPDIDPSAVDDATGRPLARRARRALLDADDETDDQAGGRVGGRAERGTGTSVASGVAVSADTPRPRRAAPEPEDDTDPSEKVSSDNAGSRRSWWGRRARRD